MSLLCHTRINIKFKGKLRQKWAEREKELDEEKKKKNKENNNKAREKVNAMKGQKQKNVKKQCSEVSGAENNSKLKTEIEQLQKILNSVDNNNEKETPEVRDN